jgi:hypothetical protein
VVKGLQVLYRWIWNFILKVEENALRSRYRNGEFPLVLLYKLPKRIGAVLLLKADCHDFVFLDLRPLDAILD